MFALPVIERELRVTARAPATHWMRVCVVVLATLLCAGILSWPNRGRPGEIGRHLFESLTAMAFVFCLVEGVRQTCDCLSQEKREGTLGLLFLARLNGFEIVFGKLVATSLTSFYGLLAVMPTMGIVFLLGGVSGGEFWRNQLVLLHTLFLASACGMVASAQQREHGRALMGGLKLLLALSLTPLLLLPFGQVWHFPTPSPVAALTLAGDSSYSTSARQYWSTLAMMLAVGWGMIGYAGHKISANYREDPSARTEPTAPVQEPLLGYSLATSLRAPTTLQADKSHPAQWLAERFAVSKRPIWLAFSLMTFGAAVPILQISWFRFSLGISFAVVYWIVELLPVMILGMAAVRVFGDARRSGALEILLSTPLTAQEIGAGHWAVIWRSIRTPLILSALLVFVIQALILSTRFARPRGWAFYDMSLLLSFAGRLLMGIAIWRTGMYFGLRMRTPALALGQTLFWCALVPWLLTSTLGLLLQLLLTGGTMSVTSGIPWWSWCIVLAESLVRVAYPILLGRQMRTRLTMQFRDLAMGTEKAKGL